MKSEHEHDEFFFCEKCDYRAPERTRLKEHIKTKHEGFRYECDLCDFKTPNRNTLNAHKNGKHELKEFFCKQCDFKANYSSSVSQHITRFHPQATSDQVYIAF